MQIKEFYDFRVANIKNKFWAPGTTLVPGSFPILDDFTFVHEIVKDGNEQRNLEVYWSEQRVIGEVRLPGEWNYGYYKGKYYHLQKNKSDGIHLNGGKKEEYFFYTLFYDEWVNEFLNNNVYIKGTITKTGNKELIKQNINLTKPITIEGNELRHLNTKKIEDKEEERLIIRLGDDVIIKQGLSTLLPDELDKKVLPLPPFYSTNEADPGFYFFTYVDCHNFKEHLRKSLYDFFKSDNLYVYDVDITKIRPAEFEKRFTKHKGQFFALSTDDDIEFQICKRVNKSKKIKLIDFFDINKINWLHPDYTDKVPSTYAQSRGNAVDLYWIDELIVNEQTNKNYNYRQRPILYSITRLFKSAFFGGVPVHHTGVIKESEYIKTPVGAWIIKNKLFDPEKLNIEPYQFVGSEDYVKEHGFLNLEGADKKFGWFLGYDPDAIDLTPELIEQIKKGEYKGGDGEDLVLTYADKDPKNIKKNKIDISNVAEWSTNSKEIKKLWFAELYEIYKPNWINHQNQIYHIEDLGGQPYEKASRARNSEIDLSFENGGVMLDVLKGDAYRIGRVFDDSKKTPLPGTNWTNPEGIWNSFFGQATYQNQDPKNINYFRALHFDNSWSEPVDILKSAVFIERTYAFKEKNNLHYFNNVNGQDVQTSKKTQKKKDEKNKMFNLENYWPDWKNIKEWYNYYHALSQTTPPEKIDTADKYCAWFYDIGDISFDIYDSKNKNSILYDFIMSEKNEWKFKNKKETDLEKFLQKKWGKNNFTEILEERCNRPFIFSIGDFVIYATLKANTGWHFEALIKDNSKILEDYVDVGHVFLNNIDESNDPDALIKAINSSNELNIYGNRIPIGDRFILEGNDLDWTLSISALNDKYQTDNNFFYIDLVTPETHLKQVIETPKEGVFSQAAYSAFEKREALASFVNNQNNRYYERQNFEIERNKFYTDIKREEKYEWIDVMKEGAGLVSQGVTTGAIVGGLGTGGMGMLVSAVTGLVSGIATASGEFNRKREERADRLRFGTQSLLNQSEQMQKQHEYGYRTDLVNIRNMANSQVYNNTFAAVNYKSFNSLIGVTDVHLTQRRPKGKLLEMLKHHYKEYGFDIFLTDVVCTGINTIDGFLKYETILINEHENATIKKMIEVRMLNGVKVMNLDGTSHYEDRRPVYYGEHLIREEKAKLINEIDRLTREGRAQDETNRTLQAEIEKLKTDESSKSGGDISEFVQEWKDERYLLPEAEGELPMAESARYNNDEIFKAAKLVAKTYQTLVYANESRLDTSPANFANLSACISEAIDKFLTELRGKTTSDISFTDVLTGIMSPLAAILSMAEEGLAMGAHSRQKRRSEECRKLDPKMGEEIMKYAMGYKFHLDNLRRNITEIFRHFVRDIDESKFKQNPNDVHLTEDELRQVMQNTSVFYPWVIHGFKSMLDNIFYETYKIKLLNKIYKNEQVDTFLKDFIPGKQLPQLYTDFYGITPAAAIAKEVIAGDRNYPKESVTQELYIHIKKQIQKFLFNS